MDGLNIPKYVGYLVIGGCSGIHIAQTKKPNVIHRAFLNILLGIKWRDIE